MKKLFVSVLLSISLLKASADEGMWLPMLLGQQVYNDMVKRGLKLTKEQLYAVNKSSLKDAILIFGGGCTGEIVSSEGLILPTTIVDTKPLQVPVPLNTTIYRMGFTLTTKARKLRAS